MINIYIKKINIVDIIILLTLTMVSIASSIILHIYSLNGREFLPIFFSLSLGAYILNPFFLIFLSIILQIINYFFTNMPIPPILYFLIFEGVVFSVIISIFKNKNISFILLSLIAFIAARLSSIVLTFIFNIDINTWFNNFINGYKGIMVNFSFASIVYLISKNIMSNNE